MSLTAYGFQFYSYNMPSQRDSIYNDDSMVIDDIDLSTPPPKPARTFAMLNSSIDGTAQITWMASTPRTIGKENQDTAVNYLAAPNETPKTIYISGLAKNEFKSAEPQLHATQKRWSNELRERALEMSKRSSAGSGEEELENSLTTLCLAKDKQVKNVKPQHPTERKTWSFEIRKRALEMSKRNSAGSGEEELENSLTTLCLAEDKEVKNVKPQHPTERKSWSFEIRKRALEMSKRNSASFGEAELGSSLETLLLAKDEQATKVKPYAESKSWSCLIQEKALEMSKRNSVAFKRTEEELTPSTIKYFDSRYTSPTILVKEKNSISFHTLPNIENSLNDAKAYEKLNMTTPIYREQPFPHLSQTVKERISFFNKLNNDCSNSTSFIKLLKNTKTKQQATIQKPCSSTNVTTTQNTPNEMKFKRWSTQLEMNFKQNSVTNTYFTKSQDNITVTTQGNTTALLTENNANGSTLSCSYFASSTSTLSSCQLVASPIQRKCSLRRRDSIEKSRRPIITPRQNSTASTNGTKPQMHTAMEDLSLVMPVKLRVAEYERRIMMEN